MRFKRGLRRAAFLAGAAIVITTVCGCDSGKKHAAGPSSPSSPSVSSVVKTAQSTSTPAATSSKSSAASAAPSQPTNPGSPSDSLRVAGTVNVPLNSNGLTLQTETPDGTVFVGSPGGNVVWTAKIGVAPAVAEHVAGGVDALAADATYLYIASGHTVYAYARSTGELARQWSLPAGKDSVLNLEVTGARLWVRMGMQASDPPPGAKASLIELNIAGGGPLRQFTVPWTTWLAGGPSGLYYVLASQTIFEQTDAGTTVSAPVNDPVNLKLSGPDAIQVVGVEGNRVIAVHFAGQGLDATLDAYDATTLKGPSQTTEFSAAATVVLTADGLVAAFDDAAGCGGGRGALCLAPYLLGSDPHGKQIPIAASELIGGQRAVAVRFVDTNNVTVTWFGR